MFKPCFRYISLAAFCVIILSSCVNYKRLVADEVVLKDQNSHTGTIMESDSSKIKLKKIDESMMIIKWDDVDTVVGKKLKTVFIGASIGYYNIPYFSVFRNEAMTGHAVGYQYRIGYAYRGNTLCYFNYLFSPASPYAINKLGVGYQRYLGTTSYLKRTAFYFGGEANIMNVKNNNGAQFCIEPFTGYELKLAAHVRMHLRFGLQLNLANKNSSLGSNFSLGFNFMRKNFKKRYDYLNTRHRVFGQ
jgi:hypothetical protein